MASHILMFPTDLALPALARRSRLHAAPSSTEVAEAPSRHGLQLVYSRSRSPKSDTPDTRTQAQRIAAQVECELAGRVQREATERRSGGPGEFRLPSHDDRRALSSRMPPQVTEIGLRHRLLDALLFFARPA